MFRIGALSFGILLAMTASPPHARAANDVWDGNGNVPPSNNWSFDPSWVDNSSPGNSDTATFNIADTYTVSFSVNNLDAIQALTVSSGHVTFASTSSTGRHAARQFCHWYSGCVGHRFLHISHSGRIAFQ